MKEHKKELLIIPLNSSDSSTTNTSLTTAKIMYNNYEIGICEFQVGPKFPNTTEAFVSPFNTEYRYTLIFFNKDDVIDQSLNIAMDSIQTNGFYRLVSGVLVNLSNLNMPIGTYKNIGISPEGNRYNLELTTDKEKSKIILSRIC